MFWLSGISAFLRIGALVLLCIVRLMEAFVDSFPGKSFTLIRLLLRRKIIHFPILRYQFDIFIEQVLIITLFDPDICISLLFVFLFCAFRNRLVFQIVVEYCGNCHKRALNAVALSLVLLKINVISR